MPSRFISKLPPVFLERLHQIYPQRVATIVLRGMTRRRPTTFRVNTLKASPHTTVRTLRSAGFRLERVPWNEDAWIMVNKNRRALEATEAYQTGGLYVQGLSSMLPPLLLDVHPGQVVLDVTAAPGSKTTQLAMLMGNAGHVLANDNNQPRFARLQANIMLQGATCVDSTLSQGETLWRRHEATFDRALVDVPCSAEGRFCLQEPSSYRHWKLRTVHAMARQQRRLLASAIKLLKPGGMLVYSTCTMAPEENEGVISWALERFAEEIDSVPCRVVVTNRMRVLTGWEQRTFHADVRHAVRIIPTDRMEGFFLAKLRKRAKRTEANSRRRTVSQQQANSKNQKNTYDLRVVF